MRIDRTYSGLGLRSRKDGGVTQSESREKSVSPLPNHTIFCTSLLTLAQGGGRPLFPLCENHSSKPFLSRHPCPAPTCSVILDTYEVLRRLFTLPSFLSTNGLQEEANRLHKVGVEVTHCWYFHTLPRYPYLGRWLASALKAELGSSNARPPKAQPSGNIVRQRRVRFPFQPRLQRWEWRRMCDSFARAHGFLSSFLRISRRLSKVGRLALLNEKISYQFARDLVSLGIAVDVGPSTEQFTICTATSS